MGPLLLAAFGGATLLAMLVLHRVLRPVLGRGVHAKDLLGENRATALAETGFLLAIFLVGAGVIKNCVHGESLTADAMWCAVFAALGFALLELTGVLGTRLLLGRRLRVALESGNEAAGLAAACHYVASGLIIAQAVAGSDVHGILLSLTFFVLAQVAQQSLVGLFRLLTVYDDSEQIEGENIAAAVSYGGVSIGISLVVARALEGDFVDWPSALAGFGTMAAAALAIYPVRQLLVQTVVLGARPTLRGGALDTAIGRDRNVGAAALEAATYIGAALAIVLLA